MTDQFAIVTQTTPAAPGTISFTSGSITQAVKAALFIFSAQTTDDSTADHGCLGIGMWANDGDGGTETMACMFSRVLAGVAATDARMHQTTGSVVTTIERDAAPVIDIATTAVTAVSGGVDVTFGTTAAQIKVTALLFAGLSRTFVSQVAADGTLRTETCGATVSFRPDVLIVFGSEGGFTGTKDDFNMSVGFVVDGGATAGSTVDFDRGTNPMDADGRVDGVQLPYIRQGTGGTLQSVAMSMVSTGYQYQLTSGGVNSPDLSVMALKFSNARTCVADNLTAPSGTGTTAFSLGVAAELVIGMSSLITSENSTTDGPTAATAGLFAFNSTTARAYTGSRHEGTAGTTSKQRQSDRAVLTLDHDGAIAQEATVASMGGNGFSLSFSTATSGLLSVLAIGASSQSIIQTENEQVSETVLAIIGKFSENQENEQVSESVVLVLDDGLSDRGPAGFVAESHPVRGAVLENQAVAGIVLG